MYERKKMVPIYFLCFFVGILFSCKTAPGAVVHDPGIGSAGASSGIDRITAGQTDIAIAGNDIANNSEQVGIGLDEIKWSIESGKDFSTILDEIIRSVRSRPVPDNGKL